MAIANEAETDGIVITIKGKHNRGKTTTARLIEDYLKDQGYTRVAVQDVPPTMDKDHRWWERFQITRVRPVLIRVEVDE